VQALRRTADGQPTFPVREAQAASGQSLELLTAKAAKMSRVPPPVVRQPEMKAFPLEERVELCRTLSAFVKDAFGGRRQSHTPGNRMILSRWAGATSTFDAVLMLAQASYGDQVMMLSRTLFEAMLDGYWISLNPVEAQRLAVLHYRQAQLLMPPAWNAHERLPGDPELPTLPEALAVQDQTRALFGDYGQRHWTLLDVWKRINAVDRAVPQDKPGELRARYQTANLTANLLLHGSGTAMNDRIGPDKVVWPGVINTTVIAGPTTTYLTEGLRHAYWSYARLCLLVANRYATEAVAAIQGMYAEAWPRLRTVSKPALKLAGRNGPCPCKSGLKVKDCHGKL
jgi:hypothetical protein